MRLEDVTTGFQYMESIGKLFGEDCSFFVGMIEGINEKMNIDLLTYLKDPNVSFDIWKSRLPVNLEI